MKITLVIKTLGVPGGGAERIFVNLANFLFAKGYQVRVVSFDKQDQQSFYELDANIEWIRLGIGNPLRRAGFGETIRRMLALRQTVLSDRPDIAVAFMHSSYVPLAFSLAFSGVPVIGSEHIVVEHYASRRLQYALLLLSSFFITRFTVISETIRAKYGWLFRRKAVFITNPVFVPTLPDEVPDKGGRHIVLSVGKLEPQKDHLTLIRAFAQLAGKHPSWDLRVVGEGSMRNQLESEVKRLGLGERIFLPGSTRNIGAEYASADIFVLPSRYESFGLVTLEALSVGLPVIGFADCPGTNEVIIDGLNGFLARPGDRVANLSSTLEYVINSLELQLVYTTGALKKRNTYEPELIFEEWVKLLWLNKHSPTKRGAQKRYNQ